MLVPLLALIIAAFKSFDEELITHLVQTVLWETVQTSALLAIGTLVGTVVLGVGCAWCVERYEFTGRRLLAWLLVLPLAMPTYVIAFAYTDLLQFSGPLQRWLRHSIGFNGYLPDIRSLGGAIVLFSVVLYPYVYLFTRAALGELSSSAIEAARSLGLSSRAVFLRVVIPLVFPALAASAMLVLMETLADVGATYYFGLSTFSANIYRTWYAQNSRETALLLALILLLLVAVIFWIERRARGKAQQITSRTHRPWVKTPLSGPTGAAIVGLLLLPILLGFVLPVVALLWQLIREPELAVDLPRFWQWLSNTFTLGVGGATFTVFLALGFAYGVRFSHSTSQKLLNRMRSMLRFGYAVPGAVIALTILWPMVWLNQMITQITGSTIFLLTGSILALIYAYSLRFFAVADGGVASGIERITPNLDAAARTLGANSLQVFWRVHRPLMMRSVGVAWILVLIDVMKELPATLLLRPFNFDTLAVITSQLAQDERLAQAALPALAIVVIGLIPVLIVSKLLNKPFH
ncbi:MAG: iron ABC transporter permease [Burkholderiaceae bacterium]|nr:iron ABC transporter permease [Burkholderiaceae bacterium]